MDELQPPGTPFDAREGIDAAALAELLRAERFALGFANPRTAVLGYWIRDAGPGESTRFGSLVLQALGDTRDRNAAPEPLPPSEPLLASEPLLPPEPFPPPEPLPPPVGLPPSTQPQPAQRNLPPVRLLPRHWRNVWRHVSPGDVLRAVVVGGSPTLAIAPPRAALRMQALKQFRPYRRSG